MLEVLWVVALPLSSRHCGCKREKLTLSQRVGVVVVTGMMAVAADSAAQSVFVIVVVVVLVVVDVVSGGPWTTWRGNAYLLLD